MVVALRHGQSVRAGVAGIGGGWNALVHQETRVHRENQIHFRHFRDRLHL